MDEVGLFGAQDGDQGLEGAEVGERGQAADEGDRDDAEALGPNVVQQGSFGAGADDFVAAVADGAHQRQQEMPQREIDVGDFDDFLDPSGSAAVVDERLLRCSAISRRVRPC